MIQQNMWTEIPVMGQTQLCDIPIVVPSTKLSENTTLLTIGRSNITHTSNVMSPSLMFTSPLEMNIIAARMKHQQL